MHRVWAALAGIITVMAMFAGILSAQPRRDQPPALAPFAKDDPIPTVVVKPHDRQRTPMEAAESFLAHLSRGHGVPGASIIGSDPKGYEKAWNLMGRDRPSLAEFQEHWEGTAALKVVQFEPTEGNRFFVELERVERCNEHWAVSFYSGSLETVQTSEGWRVHALNISPEDLVGINVAGHQGWQHDEQYMAKWVLSRPPDESWRVDGLQYVGRTVTVHLHHPVTRQTRTVRLIRTMEGSRGLLGIYGDDHKPQVIGNRLTKED